MGWSVPLDPQLQRLVNAGDRRPAAWLKQEPWDTKGPWRGQRAMQAAAAVPAPGAHTQV